MGKIVAELVRESGRYEALPAWCGGRGLRVVGKVDE